MAIQLVGETIDAKRAHQAPQSGDLIQLVRGVYVDCEGDLEATILAHAVRIAHYLYPNAYLSSASAVLLAPTPDGRLFISGRRNQRTRLRTLEIIQNEAPAHPSSTAVAVVGDDIRRIAHRRVIAAPAFLEAFRLRSEHAAPSPPRCACRWPRGSSEYGNAQRRLTRLGACRENRWYREGEAAEKCLLRPAPVRAVNAETKLIFMSAGTGSRSAAFAMMDSNGVEPGKARRPRPCGK